MATEHDDLLAIEDSAEDFKRNLVIIDSLQRQAEAEDGLKWRLTVVDEWETEGGIFQYATTTVNTKGVGKIEVEIGGQSALGDDQYPKEFDNTLHLTFSAANGQRREITATPTGNPILFEKMSDLYDTALNSIEIERTKLENARRAKVEQEKDAFEQSLDEIGGL